MSTNPPLPRRKTLLDWLKAPYRLINHRLYRHIEVLEAQLRGVLNAQAELDRALNQSKADGEARLQTEQTARIQIEQTLAQCENDLRQAYEDLRALEFTAQDRLQMYEDLKRAYENEKILFERTSSEIRSIRAPSILLNAIPKSAGVYIRNALRARLMFEDADITAGIFPNDIICHDRLPAFMAGNKVAHHHFDASPTNLWFMRTVGLRVVVHVRDPRACILSWVHHLKDVTSPSQLLPHPANTPPAEYFGKDFGWRLDWMIDHHFPIFVRWIEQWAAAAPDFSDLVLLTSYEDFISDESAYFDRIIDFFGIPRARYFKIPMAKSAENNFRSGTADEWRGALTREQIERCNTALPTELAKKFGWR
jgi:hypothetical protein